jgi:hypothetical protein
MLNISELLYDEMIFNKVSAKVNNSYLEEIEGRKDKFVATK